MGTRLRQWRFLVYPLDDLFSSSSINVHNSEEDDSDGDNEHEEDSDADGEHDDD